MTPVIAGVLSALSSLILIVSAITIFAPKTPLSRMWDIKPAEYQQLLALGWPVGAGFLVIAAIAILTAVGVFRRRRWGWALAVLAIGINCLSDAARALLGSPVEGMAGVLAAGLVLWWLLRPAVRAQFH
jgi:hypothetical protein